METQTQINDKINQTLADWKSKLDDFQVQLSLGKMEALEEYEKQKKKLTEYLHSYSQIAEEVKGVTKEKAKKIKSILVELKTELKKEEAVTEKIIQKQKEMLGNLLDKINRL